MRGALQDQRQRTGQNEAIRRRASTGTDAAQ
jgi:hypothetical protein